MSQISVSLIASTPEAAKVVASAAKLCYSASGAADIMEGLNAENTASFLKMLRNSGHLSPFEHASYTFAVEGISRVATHQLVRHRLASYSQQSQRYVRQSAQSCIMPPKIADIPAAKELFEKQVQSAWQCYSELTALGVSNEDARFILPHGAETSIIITMNARELQHFFCLRLCKRAQWEIRELAMQMLKAVYAVTPELFENAGPSCISHGYCTEAHSCGNPYVNMESMLAYKTNNGLTDEEK